MTTFGKYARFYDRLYEDKDYAGEARFVANLVRRFDPNACTILEFGCGTGRHAIELAKDGFEVRGIDLSEGMLKAATRRLGMLDAEVRQRLHFSMWDIRTLKIQDSFDAVIALFHVISYQISNRDLRAVLAVARHHLKPRGVFIFDCWYGPAVLSIGPRARKRSWKDGEKLAVRTALPDMHPNENVVDVTYRTAVYDSAGTKIENVEETHRMRYLFQPELDLLFADVGLDLIERKEWMTGEETGYGTWSGCFVCRRKER